MTTSQTITMLAPALNAVVTQLGCIHALTGRAPAGKMCAHSYDCGRCPYDQMLEDTTHTERCQTGPVEVIVRAA